MKNIKDFLNPSETFPRDWLVWDSKKIRHRVLSSSTCLEPIRGQNDPRRVD